MQRLLLHLLSVLAILLTPNAVLPKNLAGAGGNFGLGIDRISREVTGKFSENKIHRSRLNRRIYYSFTLVGDQNTLNSAIDDSGVSLHVTIWCNDEKKDTFFIGITQNEIQFNEGKFRAEIRNKGIFTWRTHFNTSKIWCSKLEFIIDGPDGTLRTIGGRSNFTPSIRIES